MSDVEFVGPFEYHAVVVDSYTVPFLTAEPLSDGGIHLQLDNRFGLDLTLDQERSVVRFIADCIAIALGYSCHPRPHQDGPRKRTSFKRNRSLDPGPS